MPRTCPFFGGECPADCGAGKITDSIPALGQLPYPLYLIAVTHFPDILGFHVPIDPFGDWLFSDLDGSTGFDSFSPVLDDDMAWTDMAFGGVPTQP